MRGLAFAIECDNQSEANRNFGCRHRDDEEDHDLAVQVVVETRESDEREVRGVEHEFEAHVHHEQVAPHDDTEHAEAEEKRADNEVMFETDAHDFSSLFFFKKNNPQPSDNTART